MQRWGPISHPFCKEKLSALLFGVLMLNPPDRVCSALGDARSCHRLPARRWVNFLMNLP